MNLQEFRSAICTLFESNQQSATLFREAIAQSGVPESAGRIIAQYNMIVNISL